MSDTVTVPRWAVEEMVRYLNLRNAPRPMGKALLALERALDTKTEMPDEPGHPDMGPPCPLEGYPLYGDGGD